jgi:hypothetical protein
VFEHLHYAELIFNPLKPGCPHSKIIDGEFHLTGETGEFCCYAVRFYHEGGFLYRRAVTQRTDHDGNLATLAIFGS